MKNSIGKPCEGKLQARFDEGGTDSLFYLLSLGYYRIGYQALLYVPIRYVI